MICPILVTSQIVLPFKDNINEDHYDYCLVMEDSISREQNPLRKGELLYELSKITMRHHGDLAIEYLQLTKDQFRICQHDSLYHMALCSMSFPYIGKGEYEKASECIEEGLAYWKATKNKRWIANTLIKKGYLEKEKANLVDALRAYQEAYNIQLDLFPLDKLGDISGRIGRCYMEIGDYRSALSIFEKFLDTQDRTKPVGFGINIMASSAECYRQLGDPNKAAEYQSYTNDYYIRSPTFNHKVYGYLGRSLQKLKKEQFAEAKMDLDSSLYYAEKFELSQKLAHVHSGYVDYYTAIKKYDKIPYHLEQLLYLAQQSNKKQLIQHAYQTHAEYHNLSKNYRLALHYHRLSDSLYREIYSEDVINEIKHLDASIQKKQSEEQIQILEEKNDLQAQNIANAKKIRWILTMLSIVSLLVLMITYLFFRQRVKATKILKDKNETISKALETNKVLLKEIHHRVKNNLQVISSLLSLQARYNMEGEGIDAIQTAQSRVQAMSLLHLKLYNKEDISTMQVKAYFTELIHELVDTYKKNRQPIQLNLDIEDISLDIEEVIPLGLIANELITNSLKYAFQEVDQAILIFTLVQKENDIHMSVKDNGPGFPFEEVPEFSTSLGMEIIKSFTEKLDGNITIDNSHGAALEISFSIPDNVSD